MQSPCMASPRGPLVAPWRGVQCCQEGSQERQRQAHHCEFKASMLYRGNSKTARATQRDPVSSLTHGGWGEGGENEEEEEKEEEEEEQADVKMLKIVLKDCRW